MPRRSPPAKAGSAPAISELEGFHVSSPQPRTLNPEPGTVSAQLLDQLRNEIRVRHYSIRTEHAYTEWVGRFFRHYTEQRPEEMGAVEINRYLSYLATDCNVAASTQNQALNALLFFFGNVLKKDVSALGEVVRAKRPARVPVVLSVEEVERLLPHLDGVRKLMALLMYGSGMRIIEVLRLRVKDVDFDLRSITVRDGKGQKDRQVPLPLNTIEALKEQIRRVKLLHDRDLKDGYGTVYLPFALARKYPNTERAFHWQYVFPSPTLSTDPRSGKVQRHHVYESVLQSALRGASREAGINKDVHAHTMRHSFATHLLIGGSDIRTVQDLLGHKNVKTTMIYTHVLKAGPQCVTSPADRLRPDVTVLTRKAEHRAPPAGHDADLNAPAPQPPATPPELRELPCQVCSHACFAPSPTAHHAVRPAPVSPQPPLAVAMGGRDSVEPPEDESKQEREQPSFFQSRKTGTPPPQLGTTAPQPCGPSASPAPQPQRPVDPPVRMKVWTAQEIQARFGGQLAADGKGGRPSRLQAWKESLIRVVRAWLTGFGHSVRATVET